MKKAIIILFATLLAFSIISCDNNLPDTIEVTSVTITGITESQGVEKGETVQLSATVLPEDATDKGITWVSSDDKIATISETGLLTGVAEGKVTISAIASNGVKDEVTISIVKMFTVTFDADKPEEAPADTEVTNMPEVQKVGEGDKATTPSDPVLPGYVFQGWFREDGTQFSFDTPITDNITLYAHWTEEGAEPVETFTITFEGNKPAGVTSEITGMPEAYENIQAGNKVTAPENPTLEGYVFEGWYLNGSLFTFEDPITGNITLQAQWKEREKFFVRFNNGLEEGVAEEVTGMPEDREVYLNDTVTKPESDPVREGYKFLGWYLENSETPFDFSSPITEEITLYAHWEALAPEPPSDPELKEEGTLVEKTTEEKSLIESTINLLSDEIMNALANGETVTLNRMTLSNGVTVEEGTISVEGDGGVTARSMNSSSKQKLKINITKAKDKDNKAITLDYESNVTVENAEIVGIEPVATTATVDNAIVSDIDSDTFIPVALAFSNKDLLSGLGNVLHTAVTHLDKLGVEMTELSLNVPDIGIVIVDCQKSGLSHSGKGILVFRIPDLDNQWHTMSSIGGQITIDGWADVDEEAGAIEDSSNPIVKDDEKKSLDDMFVVSDFAPRFYALYYQMISMMGEGENSHEFTAEELAMLNIVASTIFDGDITFNSYILDVSDHIISDQPMPMSYEDPGIINVSAVTSKYGAVNMTIHLYAWSNDIADAQIVKMEIGGEDYSYLSYDMIKSMLKVFGQFAYVSTLVDGIVTYPGFQATEESTFTLNLNNQGTEQIRFNGSVDISGITKNERGKTIADFKFSGLELNDSYGDVDYTLSGAGTFTVVYNGTNYPEIQNLDIYNFNILGFGNATEAELAASNAFLNLMYIEPTQSVDFEIPEEFCGTFTSLEMEESVLYVITVDDVFRDGESLKETFGVTSFSYNENAMDDGNSCKMIILGTDYMGGMTYSFALHEDGTLFVIGSAGGTDMRAELIPVTTN